MMQPALRRIFLMRRGVWIRAISSQAEVFPPGFPATLIDGQHYWDGGLFDNTPLPPLFDLLTEDETENLPIIMIDLIPNADHVPKNLHDVRNRMSELSFENRFWDEYGGHQGLVEHARILNEIDKLVPVNHPLR